MDMTRYGKIDGFTALTKLAGNERIYNGDGSYFFLDSDGLQAYDAFMDTTIKSEYRVNYFINHDWYIKKPFDVRQAMRDKPDEWVAAFKTSENDWVKVGFDTSEFTVVGLELSNDAPINATHDYFKVCVYGTDLDVCIPLEEVPADAK